MLLRILPLSILLILGLRYFLMALKPRLFKIDYFMIDEAKETLLDKMDHLKTRVGINEKPAPAQEAPVQSVRDEGYTVYFEQGGIKAEYRKDNAMSNIFLVISLHPELHAKNRFAEGSAGLITLKNAARLKSKYPELLTPRGLRAHIDECDVEQFLLLYPPHKAAMLKAKLKEAHRAMFTGTERIHIQLKGQLLAFKQGWVNNDPVPAPVTGSFLYLQQAELIQAYGTPKQPSDDNLSMHQT